MADLIDKSAVTTRFPEWQTYVQRSGESEQDAEDRLDLIIEDAEAKLQEYIDVGSETMSAPLRLHLLNVIRKRAFDVKHGNKDFDDLPQILKDYEHTLEMLDAYRAGEFEVPSAEEEDDDTNEHVRMHAKDRRFKRWFGPLWPGDPDRL